MWCPAGSPVTNIKKEKKISKFELTGRKFLEYNNRVSALYRAFTTTAAAFGRLLVIDAGGVPNVPYLSAEKASALQGARLPEENVHQKWP